MTSDQDMPNTVAPESLARWMARPADEGPFWQRQREAMQGPVEPMEKESWSALGSLYRNLTNAIRRLWQ